MKFADQRVLQNIPATLSVQFVDQDGAPHAPAGAVTVGITRADGTVLLAPGQATVDGATAGVKTFAVTATHTALLEHFKCTWTAASGEIIVTHVDVVGAYYFALSDLSALDGMTGLSTEQLRTARQSVEEMIEQRTGWSWVPKLAIETVGPSWVNNVSWTRRLVLTHRPVRAMRSIKVDTVAQTLTNWSIDEWGVLGSMTGWSLSSSGIPNTIELIYEIGDDRPPVGLITAIMDAAAQTNRDRKSGTTRALGVTNEYGNISYARATAENLFGTPAVDAVLAFWDRRVPAVA